MNTVSISLAKERLNNTGLSIMSEFIRLCIINKLITDPSDQGRYLGAAYKLLQDCYDDLQKEIIGIQ